MLEGRFAFSAFSGVDEIKANTGRNLRVAPGPIPEPTVQELANLCKLDQTGALRKK